jgi:hypothetical protein
MTGHNGETNMSKRKYYTVIEKLPDGEWTPQFGDYDRAVADQEMRDMKDSGSFVKGTKLKVITTDGSQQAIMAKCLELGHAER